MSEQLHKLIAGLTPPNNAELPTTQTSLDSVVEARSAQFIIKTFIWLAISNGRMQKCDLELITETIKQPDGIESVAKEILMLAVEGYNNSGLALNPIPPISKNH